MYCAIILRTVCNPELGAALALRLNCHPGVQALVVFSRLGVYMRLPGVDVDRFAESMSSGGLMGYFDALTGGSISKVGVFSLGEPALAG